VKRNTFSVKGRIREIKIDPRPISPSYVNIIIIIFFKNAGRKTRLDIQNYGCNGNLLCYHIIIIIIMCIKHITTDT